MGGWRGGKIYGRLDCASALRNIAKGNYGKERVFFADEATAIAAGYRHAPGPCIVIFMIVRAQFYQARAY